MIEMDNNWGVKKALILIVYDELETIVSSLRIKERKEFLLLTLTMVFVLVIIETPTRQKFVIETVSAHGITRTGRCYTLEELAHGGKTITTRKEVDKRRQS